MFFALFFASAVIAAPFLQLNDRDSGLEARDNVHKATYLTKFNYTVTADEQGSYQDRYDIAFFQDKGDSVICSSSTQPSDPANAASYPNVIWFDCTNADGSALSSPRTYRQVGLYYTAPLRPEGTTGTAKHDVFLNIVPNIPESYVFQRANVFKDGKFSCTNGGVVPFTCILAGSAPQLRLEENLLVIN